MDGTLARGRSDGCREAEETRRVRESPQRKGFLRSGAHGEFDRHQRWRADAEVRSAVEHRWLFVAID